MTASFVTRTISETSSAVTSRTLTKPTGLASGDLLIFSLCMRGSSNVGLVTPPDGTWTVIRESYTASTFTSYTAYKIAGGSEPADYTFSWTNSGRCQTVLALFTGNHDTTPIDASAHTTENSSAPTHPTVTTTVDDCLILRLAMWASAPTFTVAGTQRWEEQEGVSSGEGQACGTEVAATAGATGTADSSGTSQNYYVATIAIAPVAAAGGQPTMRRWGNVPGMRMGNRIAGRSW